MAVPESRDQALALDAADPVAAYRDRFLLPEGTIYLDGNSLGPPTRATVARLEQVLHDEWRADLVQSWTRHGWIDMPARVASGIAPLIGAAPDELVVSDSISVNLFKLLVAALRLRPGRTVILSERQNFPTDLYIAQGIADLLQARTLLRLVDRAELGAALADGVAVLMLTQVDFRTGEIHDMAGWTQAAHDAGALALWDLAHSAGVMPVDLSGCGVDLAVGCGYKYLNGGPGAPAFAFCARRHHDRLRSPLWGWMGHRAPFDFEIDYRPAAGVERLRVGTPPILSLAALECGVATVAEIGIDRLRAKSMALSDLFIALVERECVGHGLVVASPREATHRGSQVSLRHPEGYAVSQALIAAGIVCDFRAPDLLRFGFAPAYVRFVDVWDAVRAMSDIMIGSEWDRPEYRRRRKVT